MHIVKFNDRMREYGDMLKFFQPSSRKVHKKSVNADWLALESVTDEEICTATYDELPKDYRTHIDGQYEVDFRDMDETDFLEAMLNYETIEKARRASKEEEEQERK